MPFAALFTQYCPAPACVRHWAEGCRYIGPQADTACCDGHHPENDRVPQGAKGDIPLGTIWEGFLEVACLGFSSEE